MDMHNRVIPKQFLGESAEQPGIIEELQVVYERLSERSNVP